MRVKLGDFENSRLFNRWLEVGALHKSWVLNLEEEICWFNSDADEYVAHADNVVYVPVADEYVAHTDEYVDEADVYIANAVDYVADTDEY